MNLDWLTWELVGDVVQIAILYLAIYSILKAARGSRFGQVLTGVGVLFGVSIAFTYLFHFEVLARILQMLLMYLALSTVVLFQPEIRRILATIGSLLFSESQTSFDRRRVTPELMTDAILELSKRKIGALIAFERAISLRGYEESGVILDAIPSRELLLSVFTEPLPLHDGGVTMRNGRIASAHCLFPVSANPKLSESGMRHRAAVGLSEETDALVIAVSEETKSVSVAHNGRIVRYAAGGEDTRSSILRWMRKAMPEKRSATEQAADWFRSRVSKFGKGKSK
ncbi:MAG: diadenylate cyclase [Lentisphaerae bacterium]|nr:diadenylate cyclase [Lentisphaerota bacterium]